jgi:hypothetical protein
MTIERIDISRFGFKKKVTILETGETGQLDFVGIDDMPPRTYEVLSPNAINVYSALHNSDLPLTVRTEEINKLRAVTGMRDALLGREVQLRWKPGE